MTFSASGALAVELRPHSPTHWTAVYYPMVHTPAGRWADVTWVLHQQLLPATEDLSGSAQWIEMRSPVPEHPRYTHHRGWGQALAAGYLAALIAYDAEGVKGSLSFEDAQRLREATVVIAAGQLAEWVLDDLQEETSHLPG